MLFTNPFANPLSLFARPDNQIPPWPELPNCEKKKLTAFGQALELYHQDEAEKAIELLEKALTEGDEKAMYGIAYIEAQRRNLEEATEYLKIVMDETDNKGILGSCHFLKAYIYEEQRMYDRAIKELVHAEQLYKEADYYEGIAQTHFFLSSIYAQQRKFKEQERHAKIAHRISSFKNEGRGYANAAMSKVYAIKGDPEMALQYLEEALNGFREECNKYALLGVHFEIAFYRIYLGKIDGVEDHIQASFPPTSPNSTPTLVTAWNHLNYVMLSKCTGTDASQSHVMIRRFLKADTGLKARYETIQAWVCEHDHENVE